METVTRRVTELNADERLVYETALGHQLHENQQVILQVITFAEQPAAAEDLTGLGTGAGEPPVLPDWCHVYEGLSDPQIAELEQVILQRADLTRPSN